MPFPELLAIAVALAMDAFAVALATGICLREARAAHTLRMAGAFGLFQALMPIAGWLLGLSFREHIEAYDHWLAFALLAFVGGKMLWEGLHTGEEDPACEYKDPTRGGQLLLLAVATSIDALAVGLSFAAVEMGNIYLSVSIIALTTFTISLGSVFLGHRVGALLSDKAQIAGGVILVLIGLKIAFFG